VNLYLSSIILSSRLWPQLSAAPSTAGMTSDIEQVFQTLLTTGTAIGWAVCAVFVALAGFQYMAAGGNPRALEGAKQSLFSALIGLGIILGAHVLATLLNGALANLPQS